MKLALGPARTRRILGHFFSYSDPRLQVQTLGLTLPNPIGLAAGFDKEAAIISAVRTLDFGFEEVGTIVPLPQLGNPRPRLFRLTEDRALINRMGFNSLGADVAQANLRRNPVPSFNLGINVGANKTSVQAKTYLGDYVTVTWELAEYGDYITVNVSSPNTPGLRDFQGKEKLRSIVGEVIITRNTKAPNIPVLVKIAPDLSEAEIDDILEVIADLGVSGIIATNTTIERPETLKSRWNAETGGLSGEPLRERSTKIIRYIYQHTEGRLPIIGVGGVFTAEDALAKIMAGAVLVQTYTGLVYEGPRMPWRVKRGIVKFLEMKGVASVQDLVGSEAQR
jgi:dihydroorotate dehydrogenase